MPKGWQQAPQLPEIVVPRNLRLVLITSGQYAKMAVLCTCGWIENPTVIMAIGVTIMRVVGVREFRDVATKLLKGRVPVLIIRRSKVAGDGDLSLQLRRDMQLALARKIQASLKVKGLTEQDILDDFEATRKARG